jgi:hypothetical protein
MKTRCYSRRIALYAIAPRVAFPQVTKKSRPAEIDKWRRVIREAGIEQQ